MVTGEKNKRLIKTELGQIRF